jgi:hypothetical protein
MKRDKIIIEKGLVPYNFNILLADELFNITVNYNEKHDFFTVALKKDGETVCEGEPLVYGMPLFGDVYIAGKYPAIDIIPLDESGMNDTVTFETLGETVFLIVDNMGGEDIG